MYHEPVLLAESLDGLITEKNGTYVDLTFGGGGHTKALLDRLEANAKVFAFDRDERAIENKINDKRLTMIHQDYRYLKNFADYLFPKGANGILADLGVSSYQIDTDSRGFSFRFNGPLDMRMDTDQSVTAADILNEASDKDLYQIFKYYGEIKNTGRLVKEILAARSINPFKSTFDLKECVLKVKPGNIREHKYLSQVFQALRIRVNNEMESLEKMLVSLSGSLCAGGRAVIITYHSLEDRLVKNLFQTGNIEGKAEKDLKGNLLSAFRPVSRKPIIAAEQELERNPRSRSAKLRIAKKTEYGS